MEAKAISRRKLLKTGLTAGGLAAWVASNSALGAFCKVTPKQTEGPFYPEGDLDRDADLTELKPGAPPAKGEVIFVTGQVTDVDCRPIEGALVEIWQAAASGKYNHSGDTNPLPLDPNFQYWGRTRALTEGRYRFKTIIPGYYPIGGGIYRPPHIHLKVHAPGFFSLTTQMYFDPLTFEDPKTAEIVEKWNKYENVPKDLTVHFKPVTSTVKTGELNISLRRN